MTSKFNSNVGSVRAAKIARSNVVDINAYRKVKKSDTYPSIIILSRDELVCASVSQNSQTCVLRVPPPDL